MKKPSPDGSEEGWIFQPAADYIPSWLMNLVLR